MFSFDAAAPLRSIEFMADLAASWTPRNRLDKSLANLSDEELDRILISVGRSRGDLFTVFDGNAKHRQRLARMIEHYEVNLDHATRNHWAALRRADEACAKCSNAKRCRSWCGWGVKNDAPRIFCPHAELFDKMARTSSGRAAAVSKRGRSTPSPIALHR
jgi:hypothetical protein